MPFAIIALVLILIGAALVYADLYRARLHHMIGVGDGLPLAYLMGMACIIVGAATLTLVLIISARA